MTTGQTASARPLGLAYGVACGIVFSFGGLATRFLDSANSWQAVTYRSAFLAAAMLLVCLLRHRGERQKRKRQRAGQ